MLSGPAAALLRKGFVSVRTPLDDEALAKVSFGGERVVRRATQRQIRGQMRTTHRERLQMMQFEIVRLSATQATLIDIRAARIVAPIHLAPHLRRDVSTALALVPIAAAARCGYRDLTLLRGLLAGAPARPIDDGKLSLFERRDEELHGLEVEFAERDLRPGSGEQSLRSLH